jgi:hypothetical protein
MLRDEDMGRHPKASIAFAYDDALLAKFPRRNDGIETTAGRRNDSGVS